MTIGMVSSGALAEIKKRLSEMVNTTSAVRTLAVEPDLLVTQLSDSELPASGTLYRDWGEWCPITGTCPVWIRIDGGRVIYIAQEFYS